MWILSATSQYHLWLLPMQTLCSTNYLLIVIPIAIVGAVLVMMHFIFNLTVINGTVNVFIFYFNIVNINTSSSCPLVICTILSLFNQIETCFYNGMDDYTKTWLLLVFPFYLIMIASILIITSHYFITIQKADS